MTFREQRKEGIEMYIENEALFTMNSEPWLWVCFCPLDYSETARAGGGETETTGREGSGGGEGSARGSRYLTFNTFFSYIYLF